MWKFDQLHARLNQFIIAASDDAVHTKWIKLLRIVLQLAT